MLKKKVAKGVKAVLEWAVPLGCRTRKPRILKDVKPFLRNGTQTKESPGIRKFVSGFRGKELDSLEKLVLAVNTIKTKTVSNEFIQKNYSKRTASQILRDNFISVYKGAFNGKSVDIRGCNDRAILLCACLRAKGIPTRFVRIHTHSEAQFFLEGKWYRASTLNGRLYNFDTGKPEAIIAAPKRYLNRNARLVKNGIMGIGLDAWDIGINGIREYHKFNPKAGPIS